MRLYAVLLVCGLGRLAAQAPACKPLEDDRILAKNLAEVNPVFQAVPAETVIGNTPPPGSQHTVYPSELTILAQRYALHLENATAICFERAMEPLDRERVMKSMRGALQIPDARIEIAEVSLYPVPRGRIEFTPEHLGTPASPDQPAPVLWRGDVVYGDRRRFAIWARVRILAHSDQVVAVESLRPGRAIEPSQVRVASQERFPIAAKQRIDIEQVIGKMPLRPISAGSVVRAEMIARPNDINRGDMIEIEVHSGAARLMLTAKAESGGHDGDAISVRNLESNRVFIAQVAGKGKAVVMADPIKAE